MTEEPEALLKRKRLLLVKLFEFLRAYTNLRFPPIREINKQSKTLWLKDLPSHPSVELVQLPTSSDDRIEDADVVLRLTRPASTPCPAPPQVLSEWLKPGWQEPSNKVEIRTSRNVIGKHGNTSIERFENLAERIVVLQAWNKQREQWVTNERPTREALAIFRDVYEWYGIQEREGEKVELLLGDGLLHCGEGENAFHHPVLLQKVELDFYPEKESPQFVFRRREQPPELYMEFLRALPDVNNQQLARCADELKETEFSPLGKEDTTGFLRRLIQGLFPKDGSFVEHVRPEVKEEMGSQSDAAGSSSEERRFTAGQGGPIIERQPVIFMRNRHTGPSNVFELVLEDIASRDVFPASLLQILGFPGLDGTERILESAETKLSLGNEDQDVLFSKPANLEQLQIARQLERKDCVLVQGPPGTGKTHTIANLLGHLLAQGKRVLVTAHTPKALRVLREKVVEAVQPLCISVLYNDKKSQEDLQASVRKIHQRLAEDDRQMERDADSLWGERNRILAVLSDVRSKLLEARLSETRDVVYGGKAERPINAARRVKEGLGKNDWIPGPVNLGEELPLSAAEIAALYQISAHVSLRDERELESDRPDILSLPTPGELRTAVEEINRLSGNDLRHRDELWNQTLEPHDLDEFDRMLEEANRTIDFFRDSAPWQMEAIQAGRDGGDAQHVWQSLTEMIETTCHEINRFHVLVMEHGPSISGSGSPHEELVLVEEMIAHVEKHGSLGLLAKLTRRAWFDLIKRLTLSGQPLNATNPVHLRAVRALLRIQILREQLLERWERQMACQGAPTSSMLGDKPEQVCRQFVSRIQSCLEWHTSTWGPLEADFRRLGFCWPEFLQTTPPEVGANTELRRVRKAVLGDLGPILQSRSGWLRQKQLQSRLREWQELIGVHRETDADVTRKLRQALLDVVPDDYQAAYDELIRLKKLEPDAARRGEFLKRLSRSAPAWASSLANRLAEHSSPEPLGAPDVAWEWRQFHDELEKRASVSFEELQQRIEELSEQLLEVTAQLIEKQTWMNQIRQTTHEQRQALGAFVTLRNKLTKTGKGVLDHERRSAARREMATAKNAVPVWIMPLTEVAETFDPRKARFDVVIIDEASQCDPTSMFALYLGRQTVIVGDDEQVTPVTVGVDTGEMIKLINTHLEGIPHKLLYDGETSIYELAQMAFGGVIRLIEHFRCAPNIIAFSNELSYGDIKPLRESSSIALKTHVAPYRVPDGYARKDNVNENEAETIASLVCSVIEHPEYARNEFGKPVSLGVVSLLGDRQALRIDSILRQRVEPAEYQRRQILCGDSAQFQGDERDVIFLSVVDSTPEKPPLLMRQEGPKKIFKKRFNVAASRARDQMWVVYSVNHEVDLQPGDYRRRIIEHALDPGAWERELRKRTERTESVFEERVLRKLMRANFNVVPQFQAGAYRIDLVVIGNKQRLAIECDGERFHAPEKLQDDMTRQAILERLGWKFVRIRGSLFFRDEDRALSPVFRRLEELSIFPELKRTEPQAQSVDQIVESVKRRAQELRASWRLEANAQNGVPAETIGSPW